MFSVTSETVANASFQGAPARSSKPDLDASAGNDSFAALVDSNTPVDTGKDRAAAAADAQSAASQRRSDDASASAAADAKRSRNDAAADRADRKARNDSDARDTADKQSDANANADASQKSRTNSTNTNAGAAKSADKPAGDDAPTAKSADDSDASVPAKVEPAAAAPNPVAVAVTVIVAATDAAPTTPTPGQANAPLAIAAAAIAASSAVAGDAPTAPAPAQVDPTATASATTAAEVAAANAKTEAKATAGETVSAGKQPSVETDATAATDLALIASVAGTAPVSPTGKLPKDAIPATAPAVKAGGESDSAQKAADPSATVAPAAIDPNATSPQAPATGQHKAGHDAAVAGKADAANSSSTAAANLSAREHSAAPETKLASADQGLLPASSFQPQLQTAPASTAATALTATAANDTAVPLSGLALEIAASARSGKTTFEIRLDPADLGRIDVRINVDRHGQVTSHLTVEKPETLSMLRQDAPQLQRALDDAGFKTGDSGLQFSLRDQSSSGQQNDSSGQGRNAQRLIVHEDDSVPATMAGRTYGRMLGSSSGVDIRI